MAEDKGENKPIRHERFGDEADAVGDTFEFPNGPKDEKDRPKANIGGPEPEPKK
jgi:hypothetical protein